MRTHLLFVLILLLSACSLTGESTPASPTSVPASTPVITESEDCNPVASASGITIDAEEIRENAPTNTLPNGRPFPRTEPRNTTRPDNRPVRDQVMIQFTPQSSQQERNAYIQQIQGRSRRNIDRLNTYVVTVPPGSDTSNLPASPVVVRVEPDYRAVATQVVAPPNDARYGEQWALQVMGVPNAWAQFPANAPTVIVAVLDTGVCLDHPDLAGKFVAGYDFVENDTTPQDANGHGCGVAGVIAAHINNGVGIAGVAPNARIMPLRVLDASGMGTYSDIAAAVVYAADNGARILNLSLAGAQNSEILADAINYAIMRGAIVIAAAGNYNTNIPFYPAALPNVVAVGSVDSNLQRSSFSNYGPHVGVQAPGRDILTTAPNGDYQMMTGTSFASPQVAGVTAMSIAFNVPLNVEEGVVFMYPPANLPDCP